MCACVGMCEYINMYVCVTGDRAMAFSVVAVSWKGSGPVAPFQARSHRAGSDRGKWVDSLSRVHPSVKEKSVPLQKPAPAPWAPARGLEGMPAAGVPQRVSSAGCAGLASNRKAHTQATRLAPPEDRGSGSHCRPCSPWGWESGPGGPSRH